MDLLLPTKLCAMAGRGSTGGPYLAAIRKAEAATCRTQERAIVYCVLAMYGHQDEHLIGVDVHARKVVGCEVYELIERLPEDIDSRFVHTWPLPPALCSDLW
ncbi:unnamed protein product [Triticum turgidum subsp. durum]|uniref:Uncharacterized protein n=1 Tax=Triticum turgidum subsp. durum TaxID=4567 RepID=A0A9R1RR25_TRITD|nr:unnamed protein product [Triticum turgidum subsp. durum]